VVITIVQIPRSTSKPCKTVSIEGAKGSAPIYTDVKGLIRKYYLNGDECGGGVYVWESRKAAEAWFNDEWWVWIEERFGARPTLTFFDHYVTVDNENGEVRVDNLPIDLASKAAE